MLHIRMYMQSFLKSAWGWKHSRALHIAVATTLFVLGVFYAHWHCRYKVQGFSRACKVSLVERVGLFCRSRITAVSVGDVICSVPPIVPRSPRGMALWCLAV